jgi:hypothetical protein
MIPLAKTTLARAMRQPNAAGHERRARRVARQLVQRDAVVRRAHREWRRSLWSFVLGGDLATFLSAPLVYSTLIPFLVLDAWVMVFQAVCFRAWDIRRVRRRSYLAIDRHKLAYLNGLEKLNCLYCSYVNGLTAYVREVAARTEQYWCPIKHARKVRDTHHRYPGFVEYGDAGGYRKRLGALRHDLTTTGR